MAIHLISPSLRRARESVGGDTVLPASADARRYTAVEAKRRLHQAVFREPVLDAYGG